MVAGLKRDVECGSLSALTGGLDGHDLCVLAPGRLVMALANDLCALRYDAPDVRVGRRVTEPRKLECSVHHLGVKVSHHLFGTSGPHQVAHFSHEFVDVAEGPIHTSKSNVGDAIERLEPRHNSSANIVAWNLLLATFAQLALQCSCLAFKRIHRNLTLVARQLHSAQHLLPIEGFPMAVLFYH